MSNTESSSPESPTETLSASSPSCSNEDRSVSPAHGEFVDEESIHVKFQNIEIRNYDMTLGDNPSCSYGPPVQLDWDYDEANVVSLDEYEESRGDRRMSYHMQMNARHRKQLLERLDITADEIDRVIKEMKTIKKGRERTKMMLPFWKLEDEEEKAKRETNT